MLLMLLLTTLTLHHTLTVSFQAQNWISANVPIACRRPMVCYVTVTLMTSESSRTAVE